MGLKEEMLVGDLASVSLRKRCDQEGLLTRCYLYIANFLKLPVIHKMSVACSLLRVNGFCFFAMFILGASIRGRGAPVLKFYRKESPLLHLSSEGVEQTTEPLKVECFALDIRTMMGHDLAPHHLEAVPLRYCLLADRRRGDDSLLALATGILLSDCLGIKRDSDLIFDPAGKPYVLGRDRKISIAHAGYLAVVASCSEAVGVDVEPIPSYTDHSHLRVLEGIYGKAKVDRKAILSSKTGPSLFSRLWTEAEAACKRDGLALKDALKDNRDYLSQSCTVSIECKAHLITVATNEPATICLDLLDFKDWMARS